VVLCVLKVPLQGFSSVPAGSVSDDFCNVKVKSVLSKLGLRRTGLQVIEAWRQALLRFLPSSLRFSSPKKLRFEDQIETFPYSFQGFVLARYVQL
jgi:hypothetical protein